MLQGNDNSAIKNRLNNYLEEIDKYYKKANDLVKRGNDFDYNPDLTRSHFELIAKFSQLAADAIWVEIQKEIKVSDNS